MLDWLSEIEEGMKILRQDTLMSPTYESPDERMARVLREQAQYIKLLDKKYNSALVLHHIHGMNTVDAELKVAYDNLSDDAKELLK